MNRREAIEYMQMNEYSVQQEYCVSSAQAEASQQDFNDAMLTLGVTQEELDA